MMCPATSPTSRRNKRLERALATARYRPPTVLVVKCFGAGEIVAGAAFGGHCARPIGHSPPRRSPHPNSFWWVLALERSVAVASSASVPLAPLSSSGG